MPQDSPYIMSFSIGGLCLLESKVIAKAYTSSNDWNETKDLVIRENLLQARVISSAQRMLGEVIPRLRLLSEKELSLFRTSADQDQRHLLWLAICRRHAFIADFYVQVVHERYLSLKDAAAEAGIETYHGTAKRLLKTQHYIGDDFYPAIIDEEIFQKAQAELIKRAAALGRLNRAPKEIAFKAPTVFRIRDVKRHFPNPVEQAEYIYSLIEGEVS